MKHLRVTAASRPGGAHVAVTSQANGATIWDAPLAIPLTPRGRGEIRYAAEQLQIRPSDLEHAVLRAAREAQSQQEEKQL